MQRNYTLCKGISPVIGVILLVALTVALVSLATIVVFNIGDNGTSENSDATVQLTQTNDGAEIKTIRNQNVESISLNGPNGRLQNVSDVGDSHTMADGTGEYTVIAKLDDSSEEVITNKQISSDLRHNGIVSFNPPAEGVKVESINEQGEVVDSSITNKNGQYNVKESDDIKINGYDAKLDENENIDLNKVSESTGENIVDILMNGEGTEENPYEVKYMSDLQAINEDLASNYKLINDIDASNTEDWNEGDGFKPVGYDWDNQFEGEFNGQNYEIIQLYINKPDMDKVGLFGFNVGEIKYTHIKNTDITGENNVGGLVGHDMGQIINSTSKKVTINGYSDVGGLVGITSGEIYNSSSSGSIKSDGNSVGGLVGVNFGGEIYDSSSSGSIKSQQNVGGLVGWSDSIISNSYSTADADAEENNIDGFEQDNTVGGLVGYNHDTGTITESYATGDVTGEQNNVGGLVGWSNSTISKSYATGDVTGEQNNVGGIVGYNHDAGTIVESYATGDITGKQDVGGLVGWSNSTISKSYAMGDVTGKQNNVGGIVGYNHDTSEVLNSYSKTNVMGEENIGGIIGQNIGQVNKSYSISTVRGEKDIHGVIGINFGDVHDSYWNTELEIILNDDTDKSEDSLGGTEGLITDEMQGDDYNTSFETNIIENDNFVDFKNEYPKLDWQT